MASKEDFDFSDLVSESRRQFAVLADEARITLVEICSFGTNESARIAAAKEILDRGVGKPVTQLELSGREGKPIEVKDVSEDARAFTSRMAKMAKAASEAKKAEEAEE